MRERIEEIRDSLRSQLGIILAEPELGPQAAKTYLAFACLLAAGQIVGPPRQRRNLRRIVGFINENWDLLEAAIAAVEIPAVPQDQEADHAQA